MPKLYTTNEYKKHFTRGRIPYPICHGKCQADSLVEWMGKNIFIMRFFVIKRLQRKPYLKRKNIMNKNKKLKHMYVYFPFHHGTCT